MKIIKRVSDTISIYYDPEWEEYVVIDSSNPMADYHCDDKQDAIGTAECMANHNNIAEPVSMFG